MRSNPCNNYESYDEIPKELSSKIIEKSNAVCANEHGNIYQE